MNILKLAISKAVSSAVAKLASNETEAGEYHIDEVVRIKGLIKKGADYEQVQHMKVDQWAMIAVLLSKVNGATIESVVREINGVDKDTITKIKAQAQEAMDKVKAPAKVKTAGKVTAKLTYEPVEAVEAIEAIEAVESEKEAVEA